MQKVRKALTHQMRRSFGTRPSFTPRTRARASSAAEAMAKRSARPVNGGMPRSPTRITAQVVPQMRIMRPRMAQVRARDGFTMDLVGRPHGAALAVTLRILRIYLVEHPRIGDGLAQVGETRHPGHEALDPHAEAAVREGAVLADVEVPLEGLNRQAVLLDAPQQQV